MAKNYIYRKLACSHPDVKTIWEYGGKSIRPDGDMFYGIGMILKNDSRHDFTGSDANEVLDKAEDFIQNLVPNGLPDLIQQQ